MKKFIGSIVKVYKTKQLNKLTNDLNFQKF